jgi:hypothetical protein
MVESKSAARQRRILLSPFSINSNRAALLDFLVSWVNGIAPDAKLKQSQPEEERR